MSRDGMILIPEGTSGDWEVYRFTVSEEESKIDMLRGIFHAGRYCRPGTYTRLTRNGAVIMSDTVDELHDLWEFERHATGRILVNGLGLGCAVQLALKRPQVEFITVIESVPDVIKLTAPTLLKAYGGRLEIIEADAYEYRVPKGAKYSAVYHDIWDSICGDNLPEMTRLKRKYGRRADWQGCWGERECRRQEREWKRSCAYR